jgi:hypothetical protein
VQKLIYGIGAFLALLIIIGFALPRTHQIEVRTEIDAHPATVFALVNDFGDFRSGPLGQKLTRMRNFCIQGQIAAKVQL